MLVLSRTVDSSIVVGPSLIITIVEIRGNVVRLGITAPKSVPVLRDELLSIEELDAVWLAAKGDGGGEGAGVLAGGGR